VARVLADVDAGQFGFVGAPFADFFVAGEVEDDDGRFGYEDEALAVGRDG
jgi:hypothetical protein